MIERDLRIALQSVEEGLQKAKDRHMIKLINRLELLRDKLSPKVKELDREEERNKAKLKDEKKAEKKNANLKKKKEREELNKKKKLEKEQKKIMENKENKKSLEEEGLEDPKEKAKSETRDWINSVVGELGSQIDSFEAEMEGLSVKKGKTKPPRLMHLEASVARHKAHEMKLELILRLVENEELSPEQVNVVKDFVEDYVKRNQEDFDKFSDVDELYNTLPQDKVEALKALVSISQPGNVKVTISTHIDMESKCGPDCYIGTSETDGMILRKSFIHAQQEQMVNLHKLLKICSSHPSLVSVDYIFKDKYDEPFLVTEEMYPVEIFFDREFDLSEKTCNSDWWDYMKKKYWIIFRDIIKGLIHLLIINSQTCGNLSFNMYVTTEGRGRVLPSFLPNGSVLRDLADLSLIMKKILCPFEEIDDSFLPHGLRSFFKYIDDANALLSKGLLPQFLLDHPFFWCIQEKIAFALKLQDFRKFLPGFIKGMKNALEALSLYENWFDNLTGLYKEIYDAAVKHSIRANDYEERLDIVRFIWVVYSHINQKEYELLRGQPRWTPEKIENDLMSHFPGYYTNMFESLCEYSKAGVIPSLMLVSTLNLRALDDPATMFDAARPENT